MMNKYFKNANTNLKTKVTNSSQGYEGEFTSTMRTYFQPHGTGTVFINLDRDFIHPSDFQEELFTLRSAQQGDIVHILINFNGGDVPTMGAFLAAMEQCQAHIITEIVEDCSSAATFIFLKGDELRLNTYSKMMLHEIQFGTGGTASNFKRCAAHHLNDAEKRARETYKHFLSDEELDRLLNGEEFYFNSEEIGNRLDIRAQKLEEAFEEEMEEMSAIDQLLLAAAESAEFAEKLSSMTAEELYEHIKSVPTAEEGCKKEPDPISDVFRDTKFLNYKGLEKLAEILGLDTATTISLHELKSEVDKALAFSNI